MDQVLYYCAETAEPEGSRAWKCLRPNGELIELVQKIVEYAQGRWDGERYESIIGQGQHIVSLADRIQRKTRRDGECSDVLHRIAPDTASECRTLWSFVETQWDYLKEELLELDTA